MSKRALTALIDNRIAEHAASRVRARNSREHRLLACPFRQLAEKLFERVARGQAADECRLAACTPQKRNAAFRSLPNERGRRLFSSRCGLGGSVGS